MKLNTLLVFLLLKSIANGQGVDNLWLLGYDCCSANFQPVNLNFVTGSMVMDTVLRDMNLNVTNGVISDKNGNLLFYSNGVYIANSNNDTMLNGGGLNPSQFTTNHTQHGLTIPQAILILPFPADSSKYYLFHTTSDDLLNTFAAFFLYYSIVDMTGDGGLGEVVQKNTVLLNDTIVPGRLTACKHANGRDWWLTCMELFMGDIIKFLVTPQGISGPFHQHLQTSREAYVGQNLFSKQGDKFAYYEPSADLDIYDFDRCSGDFSNRIHIDINDSVNAAGAAFSPSGRFLYVPSSLYVYQFDLWAADVALSKTTVAVWDSFYSPWPPFATTFYQAQLAPDGKIYIGSGNSVKALHVINYPDSAGQSCGFCQHCISLPGYNFTIPNHPNYFLGSDSTSICDSLNIDISEVYMNNWLSIYPNPTSDILYILNNITNNIEEIQIYNLVGQQMKLKSNSRSKTNEIELLTNELPTGLYILRVYINQTWVTNKFQKL